MISVLSWYVNYNYVITIKINGDTEENPGPQLNPCNSSSICLWNFVKLSLLLAYIWINKFNIISLFEINLDSSILSNDGNHGGTRANFSSDIQSE